MYCVNLYLNWHLKYERSKLRRLNVVNKNRTFNFDLSYFRCQLRYRFTQYLILRLISGIEDVGKPLMWQYFYLMLQVTFLTFGTEDIHQIHEIIEYHIFIWNCRSFEHKKHSVSSFSYQFSFSTLTELAQTNVTTKLLSKAAISNEYMIFYHFMILVDIIHSKRQKSYL